jgi:hypothetical protein
MPFHRFRATEWLVGRRNIDLWVMTNTLKFENICMYYGIGRDLLLRRRYVIYNQVLL